MHVMTSKVCETGESSDCSAVPECLALKVQVVLSSENHLILPVLPMLYRYELCVLLETKVFLKSTRCQTNWEMIFRI